MTVSYDANATQIDAIFMVVQVAMLAPKVGDARNVSLGLDKVLW